MLPHKSHPHAGHLTRRGVLALGAGGVAACSAPPASFTRTAEARAGTFAHGVASGDPGPESAVLWTRVSGVEGESVSVTCEVATRADFSDAKRIEAQAGPARDYCVKVVPGGLQPGGLYHYRFRVGGEVSPAGQVRTLPRGAVEELRLAVVSCANWQQGYFHAYDHIARVHAERPFAAMVHLGDYIYEYGVREDAVRPHQPAHEIVSLADYRERHAQYRTDPGLQAATALMPIIPIWDDHESANDAWKTGAQNHQPDTEGEWSTRKSAAMRAYYEWMPVRDPDDPTHLWRSFSFGDLATLTCVETRLSNRAPSLAVEDYVELFVDGRADEFRRDVLGDPKREMFGEAQREFILRSFERSKRDGQPWRVLANQVIMARLLTPDLNPYVPVEALDEIRTQWEGIDDFMLMSSFNVPLYPDSWDGYPAARDVFYDELRAAGIHDMLVLTGDAHEFWASNLTHRDGERMGVELVTSSVSSETLARFLGSNTGDFNLLLTRENADAKFYDATVNGYLDLTLTPERARAEMVAVQGVKTPDYTVERAAAFTVRRKREDGRDTLKLGSPKGLNLKQRLLFSGLA